MASKHVKALRECAERGIGNPEYADDARKAADRLAFLERSVRLLRDELRVNESAWRHAAAGKLPSGIPTGPNFCKSMSRAARHTLDQTDMRKAAKKARK